MRRRSIAATVGTISAIAMLTVCGVAWHARTGESVRHQSQPGSSSHNMIEPDHDDLDRGIVPRSTGRPIPNESELIDPSVLAGLNMGVDDSYPGDAWFREAGGGKTTETVDRNDQPSEPDDRPNVPTATRVRLDVPQSVQETGYWCVPATLQMALRYKGIDVDQATLAAAMSTKPDTGTEYVDLARVANRYLFGVEDPNPNGAGYRVQTIAIGDTDPAVARTFMERAKTDLDDGYPVFAAIDVQSMYPSFGRFNHMIVITGYDADADGTVTHWTYRDPWYRVQDETYGGLKIVAASEMIDAIRSNEEPAYIW
ncbi:C39 family peptidase [Bifidobacterium aerophilum]|uniref:Peptidase C39-like domain-containing protein n=1 Tax=Bifidobacterium aerophilum TaxID=1798155 RepID=A0A6N9Z704_9BIFI|nr:C39 family peptidase [Bifidobacterium aerophilum]NEG90281.1 hypothetical protein [Bifidobacterium aerophilum]